MDVLCSHFPKQIVKHTINVICHLVQWGVGFRLADKRSDRQTDKTNLKFDQWKHTVETSPHTASERMIRKIS